MNFKHTKIACYIGFVVQAIINNFLPILFIVFQKEYGIGYERLGRIVFINFSVQIIADALTPYITKFLGYRKTVIFSHILAATGLVLLSLSTARSQNVYLHIAFSVAIYCFGSGVIEVIMSPIVELIPGKNKTADMAFSHSFYCWGQAITVVLTTVMVALFGFSRWNYIPLLWAVVPIFNILLFCFVPITEPKAQAKSTISREIFKKRSFWCYAVFMLCAGVTEITMSQWASVFVQNSLGINKTVGDLLGPCAFAVFMGAGRIFFGIFAGRFSVRRILIINNLICFLCYFAVGFFDMPALSLIACAVCGFSVSISWPQTYSLAAVTFKNGGTFIFSLFALCGDLGCSAGPWLYGLIAEVSGLKSGFLAISLFPIVMAATAYIFLKEKDCKSH